MTTRPPTKREQARYTRTYGLPADKVQHLVPHYLWAQMQRDHSYVETWLYWWRDEDGRTAILRDVHYDPAPEVLLQYVDTGELLWSTVDATPRSDGPYPAPWWWQR